MGRPPCCKETGVKKGPWTPEEDEKLIEYITKHGSGNWRTVAKHAGLNRCGKSCRLRWINYLRPDIKRGKFTEQEEQFIINLHSVLGNKWSKIATHLPGRTDNEIKNFWNTHIRKKLLQMGIDPETHKPRTDMKHLMNLSRLLGLSNNNLLSPWSHAGLGLQQPDVTHQLAQIQLFQNILQLMNMQSNLPLMSNHSLINNPLLEAYVNGTNSTLHNNGESFLGDKELHASTSLFPSAPSESQQDGALDQEVLGTKNSSSHEMSLAVENKLPALVSATFNQKESSLNNTDEISTQSPPSTMFESWDKLLDDDTIDSFWKELLDLTPTWNL